MKKLLLIFTLCAFTLGVYAQETPTTTKQATPTAVKKSGTTKHAKHSNTAVKYRCPKCDYTSTERGDCPTDHIALIKDGTYYCKDHLNEVSPKPGNCPVCHKKLTKMGPSKSKA